MKAWDSNFLLRHLLEDDASQLAVVRSQLSQAEEAHTPVFLPQIVLVEVAWFLRGLMQRRDVLDTLHDVLDDRRFLCEQAADVEEALRKARVKGDFSDHLIAAAARKANAVPVQTFDNGLRQFSQFEVHRAGQ